jgi:hypothetical protein
MTDARAGEAAPVPLVAQHQFVAILRAQGWRAGLLGTWTASGRGEATAPDGTRVSWRAPRDSDDRNEKGTWSSVWVEPAELAHADVALAAGVAGLGDDELTGPLGPQGRYRRRGLEVFLARYGLGEETVEIPYLRVAGHRIHLASGAVVAPAGTVRPRDPALAPLPDVEDPGLGRILAEALRLAGRGS